MNNKIGNFDCHLPYGLSYGATHKDWIFEESRRRFDTYLQGITSLLVLVFLAN
jgi:hypothetical protein